MSGNPPPNERAAGYIEGALVAAVVQSFVGAFSGALDSIQATGPATSTNTLLAFAGSAPGLVTFFGWIVAIISGGPLGLFGYLIGVAGGGMILPPDPSPVAGILLAMIGGMMTWGGVKSGGWRPLL